MMYRMVWILLVLIFLTGGSKTIFDLDEDIEPPEKVDLLQTEESEAGFKINRILPGNFHSEYEKSLLLIEVSQSFSKIYTSRFKLTFGRFIDREIIKSGDSFTFDGMPVDFIAGDLDKDGLDEILLHRVDRELQEWIQVINITGPVNDLFPPRKIPYGRSEEVALADMNGDRSLEIVVPSLKTELVPASEIDKIIVYFLNNDGLKQESYAIIPAPCVDVVAADTNMDGKDEIVTVREVVDGKNKQAIWTIERLDDGTYVENPVTKGNSIILFPSPTSDSGLYYRKVVNKYSRYFSQIEAVHFDGEAYQTIDEVRLWPEGLILGSTWGMFSPGGGESLAVIIDEAMMSRRWLSIYTASDKETEIHRLTMVSQEGFFPSGKGSFAYDLNFDGIDELIYVDSNGDVFAFDIIQHQLSRIPVNQY